MDNSTVNFTTAHFFQPITPDCSIIFICSISFLFGVPTHSYILWSIISGTESEIASKMFNLSLSVCEIGNCLSALLFPLSFLYSSLTVVTCSLQGLCITGRPLFQCLMCVERYLAVVHPVTFLKYKPLRYRAICSAAAWIICLGSCLCCMFLLVPLYFYIFTWLYLLQFLIFLFIQLFCCLAVLRALKQSGPGERGREREEENHMKRRAFHLILITAVSMFITYVPYAITGCFVVTLQSRWTIEVSWSFSLFCFVLAGFVQPVLYLHRAGKLSCFCSP